MIAHHIISPIILPALVAGIIILFAGKNIAAQRLLTVPTLVGLLGLAIYNLVQASAGPMPYFLGNWPAPFGIVLVLDSLSAMMLALTAALAMIVMLYVIATDWDKRGRHFHALFLFQLMGLNGAFLTADAFNLFVFFEVLLIASYGLMVHAGGGERLRAGVQYVTFNLVGSTLFLFGLAVIYAATGTLNMADLAQKLPQMSPEDAALIRIGAVLLLVVFAIKGALAPLQFWLPRSYAAAPAPVAALFAVMTKVGAYAIIRFGTLVFPQELPAIGTLWADLLGAAALLGIAIGALGVLAAKRLGMLIGFATIGSMGVIFLGVAQFTPAALVGALYYALHSTLAAALLFLLADQIAARRGSDDYSQPAAGFVGSGLLASLFMIAAIAMVGLPPLSGFIGKILLLQALSDQAAVAWGAILVGALVTMVGFARAGSALFWHEDTHLPRQKSASQPVAILAIALLLGGLIALSVMAGFITDGLAVMVAQLLEPQAYIDVQSLPKAVP